MVRGITEIGWPVASKASERFLHVCFGLLWQVHQEPTR
jgi:hypothetical protein